MPLELTTATLGRSALGLGSVEATEQQLSGGISRLVGLNFLRDSHNGHIFCHLIANPGHQFMTRPFKHLFTFRGRIKGHHGHGFHPQGRHGPGNFLHVRIIIPRIDRGSDLHIASGLEKARCRFCLFIQKQLRLP